MKRETMLYYPKTTMKKSTLSILIIFTVFQTFLLLSVRASAEIILSDDTSIYNIGDKIEFYEDKENKLQLSDIIRASQNHKFTKSSIKALNFGFSSSTIWIKTSLLYQSKSIKEKNWILELNYPLLDYVDLHIMNDDGSFSLFKSGDMLHFQKKMIEYRNPSFEISMQPGKRKTIFIKIQSSSSMKIEPHILAGHAFIKQIQYNYLLFGMFYGIMIIMIVYNLFLYFSINDKSYLYYVMYVFSFLLVRSSLDGFSAQFLWRENIWWSNSCIPFFAAIVTITGSLFIITFLNIKEYFPKIFKLLLIYIFFVVLSTFFSLIADYHASIQLSGFHIIFANVIFLIIGCASLQKGYRPARYFILAWIVYILGNILFALNRFGSLPSMEITESGMHIGSVLEVVLLSFALGDRINLIKQEKDEAQKQAIDNLHRADKLKDEFLANTSHELKTPLNGIIGIAESLIDGVAGTLSPKAVHNLSLISSSGRRLANLINDILDYSKLQHRELELCFKPLDIKSMISTALDLSRLLVGDKDVKLINTLEENSVYAYADENRLEQILLNLLGNAIKFTHSGTIRVSAETRGSFVEITVEDTGIGIPSSALDRIFESFEQVDGSISRMYGGTGIGLSITRSLVELHGGTITVDSEVGRGSVFRFTVPSTEKERYASEEKIEKIIRTIHDNSAELLEGPAGGTDDDRNKYFEHFAGNKDYDRALVHIVDDDPVNLQVLENHLSMHYYDIVKSLDGPDAISKIESGKVPDLMLLDIMMPKMSGYEVSKILRKRYSMFELPIMMLTAKNRIGDMVTGFTSGANDYLTKPFDKNELLARVKTLVTLKTAVKENRRLLSIDKEFEIARKILQTAIPEGVPVLSNIDIAVKYIPMESVGGDFYDFHIIDDNKIGVFISDVSGHGVVAALIASMVKIVFRIVEQLAADPVGLLSDMNRMLMGNMGTHFLTAAYFYVDLRNRILRYARAGHEPLIVVNRESGEFIKYLPRGRAIGLLSSSNSEMLEINIVPGDRIILYTDGIIEAMNPRGEMFGSRRLMETLIEQKGLSALELTDYILGQMFKWTGRSKSLDDDFSLVVVDIR